MIREDKELLLVDLCARLPYGVLLNVILKDKYDQIVSRDIDLTEYNLSYITKESHWIEYKPYLRPMSSMTEEERKKMVKLHVDDRCYSQIEQCDANCIDFYNSHHLDYRGLIKKGLALEAPKGMYKLAM